MVTNKLPSRRCGGRQARQGVGKEKVGSGEKNSARGKNVYHCFSDSSGKRESWDQEGEMADEIKLEIWADYI